jgi:hypothetical protein
MRKMWMVYLAALPGLAMLGACGPVEKEAATIFAEDVGGDADAAAAKVAEEEDAATRNITAAADHVAAEAEAAIAQANGAIPRAAPGTADPAWVGRWTAMGDCDAVVDLRADGTYLPPFGGEGRWSVQGNALVLEIEGSVTRSRFRRSGPDSFVVTRASGGSETITRCA